VDFDRRYQMTAAAQSTTVSQVASVNFSCNCRLRAKHPNDISSSEAALHGRL